MRGVTIPHPHSFMKEQTCNEVKGCNCQDGYMAVHLPDGQLPNSVWMTSIGGNPPYLGSMTRRRLWWVQEGRCTQVSANKETDKFTENLLNHGLSRS
ncbi:hypothetical protein G5S52_23425, partial [Grimontia sp. S25]|nr:hypothetical protein [Grimontia sedimenti]